MNDRESGSKAYYPAMLDIEGKRCLVVGGGKVAYRKAHSLLECRAVVTVISPVLTDSMARDVESGLMMYVRREYQSGDAEGYSIVVAATDDRCVNALVCEEAQGGGALVNVVDDASKCDFIVPSVLRRGDLVIAVSTSGTNPALAKKIRLELEEMF